MPRYFRIFVFSLLLPLGVNTHGADYYVDQDRGQDTFNGQSALPSGSSVGPWQTLSRASRASLQAGDTIWLACGGKWSEPLTLAPLGDVSAPVRIRAASETCPTRPAIDGAVDIPSYAWQPVGGAIYAVRLPIELLSNPTSATDISGWSTYAVNKDSTIARSASCAPTGSPCLTFTSGSGTRNSILISNSFPLQGGATYSLRLTFKAPAATQVRATVRRAGPTYESITPDRFYSATGDWQTVTFDFQALKSVTAGRLDIELPPGIIQMSIRDAGIRRPLTTANLQLVLADNQSLRPAHHPNFGSDATSPASPFAAIASDGGKTTVDASLLQLPAGVTLTPNLGITIKTTTWNVEERTVATINGARLTLDRPTDYPIGKNYGFFLTGAKWMLDSPGEWFFDASVSTLFVWMPDSQAPGKRVSISAQITGLDLSNSKYIEVSKIDIRNVGTGIRMDRGSFISLRDLRISETKGHGVSADTSRQCSLSDSEISSTGMESVRAEASAIEFSLVGNMIRDSGTRASNVDGWQRLPKPNWGAASVGIKAYIAGNSISGTAGKGIRVWENSDVRENHIEYTCIGSSDCAAIYLNSAGSASSISNNVIVTVAGSNIGLPPGMDSHAVGIYLDDQTHSTSLAGNTILFADYGVHVHNAYDNAITGNLFYGNRRYQLWMQEQSAKTFATGDIRNNRVESNRFIPVASGPGAMLESEIGDTADFATFFGNHYSALISDRIVSERWPTGSAGFTFAEWSASGRDASSSASTPAGYASFLVAGGNVVPNGGLTNARVGWTWWNATAPYATVALQSCSFGPCLKIDAGSSPTLLASPNFSVTKDQWYRVSFDLAAGTDGQPVSVVVRRGGGGTAGYEYLMPAAESVKMTKAWQRYAFVFRALKTVTANDPLTKELGARIDFSGIQPGTGLTIANLEMVPLSQAQAALQLRVLPNGGSASQSYDCAAADPAQTLCGQFFDFETDTQVIWPVTVDPYSGRAMYSKDLNLIDSDRDSIADQQDKCPNTPAGSSVNSAGCPR